MGLSRQSVIAFLLSVLIGAACGVLIILLWDEPIPAEDFPELLVVLFWATLVSLPYVGVGLLLLGLPVTWLLHRYVLRPWFGLAAAGWGGVAGTIMYNILYAGSEGLEELTGIQNVGPLYGIPTGLAWWLLYRRAVAQRDAGAGEFNSQ